MTYTYDGSGVDYGKGKLASVSSSVSTTAYTSYDPRGKVLGSTQTTDGLTQCSGSSATCTMSYQYNLAGALTDETYPSGRIVHHNYAGDGKEEAVSSRAAVNRPFKSYAQNLSYNAAGAVTDMQLGNMRWESTAFNSRLQPTTIALGTTKAATDMLHLDYTYNPAGSADQNNGNVISQTISVPDVGTNHGFVATQTYTYDELNRLKSATENSTPNGGGSSSQSWQQTYLFDRFGNRTFDTSSGATTTLPSGFNAHIYNPTIDPSNNRFSSGRDYSYDAAGNVTADATGKAFVYDGENKQTSFGTGGSTTNGGTYVYDGDGKRVKKIVGTEVTIFVYDAPGQMVAEYATTEPSSPQVNYLTADTLGTPRINTDSSGAVISRHDYLPFGGEDFTAGNRSISLSYDEDTIRKKFTGYERDEENGLDYAQARYYNSAHGRFTSVDPLSASATSKNPQSFDRYTYSVNNPNRFSDPTGLAPTDEGGVRPDPTTPPAPQTQLGPNQIMTPLGILTIASPLNGPTLGGGDEPPDQDDDGKLGTDIIDTNTAFKMSVTIQDASGELRNDYMLNSNDEKNADDEKVYDAPNGAGTTQTRSKPVTDQKTENEQPAPTPPHAMPIPNAPLQMPATFKIPIKGELSGAMGVYDSNKKLVQTVNYTISWDKQNAPSVKIKK